MISRQRKRVERPHIVRESVIIEPFDKALGQLYIEDNVGEARAFDVRKHRRRQRSR